MVTLDRIRLTGLLRKSPAQSGLFYAPRHRPGHDPVLTPNPSSSVDADDEERDRDVLTRKGDDGQSVEEFVVAEDRR